jgi:ketosteroid isomerase-like protein
MTLKHMKQWRPLVLAAILLLLAGFVFPQSVSQPPAKDELRKSVLEFGNAFVKGDVAKLAAMLTERYVHSNAGGKVLGKKEWLNWVKKRSEKIRSGKIKYNSYTTEELLIEIYGSAAVVKGRNRASGLKDGKPFTLDIRFTHLWVKEAGKWKRAAFHDSPSK